MSFKSAVIFLSVLILGGCTTIADFDTAKKLLNKGETAAAKEQLLVLAKKGFPESQLALAGIYAGQPTLESKNEALYWYAKARLNKNASKKSKSKIDFYYAKFIIDTNEVLNSQHKRIIEDSLSNAYKQDNKNAIKLLSRVYVRNMRSQQWPPEDLQSIINDLKAHKETDELALAQIRLWAAQSLIGANESKVNMMCSNIIRDMSTCYKEIYRDKSYIQAIFDNEEKLNNFTNFLINTHKKNGIDTKVLEKIGYDLTRIEKPKLIQAKQLLVEASSKSIEAVLKLIHLSNKIPGFIEYSEAEELLAPFRKTQPINVKYADAVIAYNGEIVNQDPWLAEKYFLEVTEKSSSSEFVSKSNYFLGNIYMRGLSGDNDIKKAYDHWLQAARVKMPKAYFQIGKMFYKGPSVKHDKAIAYGFIKLSRLDGVKHADKLITEIEKELTINDEDKADDLIADELQIRGYPLLGDLDIDGFDNRDTSLQGVEAHDADQDKSTPEQVTEGVDGELETIKSNIP